MKTAFFVLSLVAAAAVHAQMGAKVDEITMPNTAGTPVTFTHCTVTKIEPDGVKVSHDAGFSKIPFEFMPAAWKAAVPHDDATAAEFRERTAKAAQEAAGAALANEPQTKETEDDESGFRNGEIMTKQDVLNAWIKASNPDNISGLYSKTKSHPTIVSHETQGKRTSKTKEGATTSDADKSKSSMEQHREALLSGKYDKRAEIAALKHNLAIYKERGDKDNEADCASRLHALLKSH